MKLITVALYSLSLSRPRDVGDIFKVAGSRVKFADSILGKCIFLAESYCSTVHRRRSSSWFSSVSLALLLLISIKVASLRKHCTRKVDDSLLFCL